MKVSNRELGHISAMQAFSFLCLILTFEVGFLQPTHNILIIFSNILTLFSFSHLICVSCTKLNQVSGKKHFLVGVEGGGEIQGIPVINGGRVSLIL